MNPITARVLKLTSYIFIGLVVLAAIGSFILSRYVHSKIESHLESIGGSLGSLRVNLFTRSITASTFHVIFAGDSINKRSHQVDLQKIVLEGINLYDLIAEKKLTIGAVILDSGRLRYNNKIKFKQDNDSSKSKLSGVTIENLILRNIKVEMVSDSAFIVKGVLNFSAREITTDKISNDSTSLPFQLKNLQGGVSGLTFYDEKGFYLTTIAKIEIDMEGRQLIIDSILLKPLHSKFKFAKVANKQIDRMNVFVSKVKVSGLNFDQLLSQKIVASKIDIYRSEIYSFRDKRMPFKETEVKPLPMEALKKLEQEIEVDSLELHPSKITYEEFPAEGFKSGKIIFEDLKAVMDNIRNSNYYNKSKYATLQASAKLLGKGLIEASFLLPIQDDLPYQAKGKISGFNLYHLNPILENLAFISVSSGRLNNMNFNFEYNDRVSNGALTINYQDLKIIGLKKEKETEVSDMKTFVINTVIKNDKDKTVPIENRTGTVSFERDRKKQIFNFWWKSLFSGIKNSVLNAQKKKNKNEKK